MRSCRGDGVSAGNVMGNCSQVQSCPCASVCARVPGSCKLRTQSPPGIVTSAEKRNGKAGVEGGQTDTEEGERGWRGKTARLTPCWLVCLSHTPALSGALAGRASSPPPPEARAEPSLHQAPPPTLSQLALGERRSGSGRSVCPRPPRGAKLGRSARGRGRRAEPLALGTFAPGTPRSRFSPGRPYLPKEPRAEEQEQAFREQPHLPGRPSGTGRAGRGAAGLGAGRGARARGGAGCGAGGAARGLSERRGAGAGGGARGEKVGSDSGGAGLRALQSRPRPARPLPPGWGHRR